MHLNEGTKAGVLHHIAAHLVTKDSDSHNHLLLGDKCESHLTTKRRSRRQLSLATISFAQPKKKAKTWGTNSPHEGTKVGALHHPAA